MKVPTQKVFAMALSAMIACGVLVLGLIPRSAIETFRYDGPVNHGLSFAALALPLVAIFPPRLVFVVLGAMIFGASLEALQPLLGRAPQLSDFAANSFGVVIGGAIGLGLSACGLFAYQLPRSGSGEEGCRRRDP